MKRQSWLAGPINRLSRSNFWSRQHKTEAENGSIVVEAAIVLPLIMIVLVFFSMLVWMSAVQIALNAAVSQSVRHIAAYIYPVDLARAELAHRLQDGEEQSTGAEGFLSPWTDIAASAAEWLPEPAGELVSSALRGDWRPLQNVAATELGRFIIEPYIRQFAVFPVLDPERIRLERMELPDLNNREVPYISIEVSYQFPIRVPFTGQNLVLRERVVERVWVPDISSGVYKNEGAEGDETDSNGETDETDEAAQDSGPSNEQGEEEEEGRAEELAEERDEDQQEEQDDAHVPLTIVSIAPAPVYRGNEATVVARTNPGAVVSLNVYYKSGKSVSKSLGNATADEHGIVRWTWPVSGNTTPGIWQIELESGSTDERIASFINVAKKEAR